MTRTIDQLNPRVQQHFHDEPLGDGWIAWNLKDATRYNALIEPLQVRRDADTADGRPIARLRMVPGRQHSNLGNAVHGGITLGLIDIALFASCHQFGVLNVGPSVTLNLDTQFISAGRIDEPLDAVTELVRGDVFEWGALMAGALFGSLPVVILYSFFVDYYVSSMTGAVKE